MKPRKEAKTGLKDEETEGRKEEMKPWKQAKEGRMEERKPRT